ncbi:MAG: hypothetical protein PVS3B3_00930 [Ktedonobacteraceae bacterium]
MSQSKEQGQIEELTSSEEKEPLILQLIPAQPGWEAVRGDIEEPEKGEPGYYTEPIVCWALVEASDGRRFVTAMMPDLESSELKMTLETGNFLGYGNPSYSPNWMKLASHQRTERNSSKA